jgi:hypothetical protein
MHGFQVYTIEVDDRGIDFVARQDHGLRTETVSRTMVIPAAATTSIALPAIVVIASKSAMRLESAGYPSLLTRFQLQVSE